MSIPRRLGRLARGFVFTLQDEDRLRETIRTGRERSEALRAAFEAAVRGASEEWRRYESERAGRENPSGDGFSGRRTTTFMPGRYPPEVLAAYERLGLQPGTPMEEVDRRRRELMKRYHPDRFADADKRARAERVTAEINAAHERIERHVARRK